LDEAVPRTSFEKIEYGTPLPRWFGRQLPWWLALLIYGDSARLSKETVDKLRMAWGAETDHLGALKQMRERFAELQTSTLDTFVRLTIVGMIVAAIVALNQQVAPFIVNKKTPLPCQVAAWAYAVLTGLAIVCILVMVSPKFKEWRKNQEKTDAGVGLFVLHSRQNNHWPEFIRLNHRHNHRQQLIAFERRVQWLASVVTVLAYIAGAITLALA
jgi:hypothetical protein